MPKVLPPWNCTQQKRTYTCAGIFGFTSKKMLKGNIKVVFHRIMNTIAWVILDAMQSRPNDDDKELISMMETCDMNTKF